MNRWFALIPIAALIALGVFLMIQLNTMTGAPGEGRSYKPDALVGQPIPETVLPILQGEIETNQRPATARVLIALTRAFHVDASLFDLEGDARLLADLREATTDIAGQAEPPTAAELKQAIANTPRLARQFLALHQTFRRLDERVKALDDTLGRDELLALPGAELLHGGLRHIGRSTGFERALGARKRPGHHHHHRRHQRADAAKGDHQPCANLPAAESHFCLFLRQAQLSLVLYLVMEWTCQTTRKAQIQLHFATN